MSKEEIKEILEKQLKMLSEHSKLSVGRELYEATVGMIEISKILLSDS